MKNWLYTLVFSLALSPALHADQYYIPTAHPQEESLHPKDIPEEIRKYITTHYNGASILLARKIHSAGSITYEVVIRFKEEKISLHFDDSGKFLKKEV